MHRHDFDETFYVLEGELTFQGNDVGGEFCASLVLVEGDGRWQLACWHASPIADVPSFLDR